MASSALTLPSCCETSPSFIRARSRPRRQSLSCLWMSSTPMAALSFAKCPKTVFPTLSSSCLCSSRRLASSSASLRACGPTAAAPASALCSSSRRRKSSARVRSRPRSLSRRRASSRRASSCATPGSTAAAPAQRAWISWSRRSMASSLSRVAPSAWKSKRVAPSRAASELTAMFPSREMVSPPSVTSLQPRPLDRSSWKTKWRPSSKLSAMITSPRRNSKARAYCASKETQLSAVRTPWQLRTASRSLSSGGATRRLSSGRKVMGSSMCSLRCRTHLRPPSAVSQTTASR
mmetsp:Transcript_66113/g.142731  ORF Transcript_66113/g.142731 Transcript_66113/m.142731 type:complete len:291 (-) Transcript_66113:935-1807(-)